MSKFIGALAPEQLTTKESAQQQLAGWQPQHDYLCCFDVDGHLLDNMAAKQMIVFQPVFMDIFNLRQIETFYRLHAEAHNLWNTTRGSDRHEAKNMTLLSLLNEEGELAPVLAADPALKARMVNAQAALQKFIDHVNATGGAFGYDSLLAFQKDHPGDDDLVRLLTWSKCCDLIFPFVTIPMDPFPCVDETLRFLADKADVLIVSKTPYDDILNWLEAHDLLQYVTAIGGKEQGDKDELICLGKGGEYADKQVVKEGQLYPQGQVIMGGDGGGDLKAAQKNGVWFFPTPSGAEEAAWGAAIEEVFKPFLAGTYRENEPAKIKEFEAALQQEGCWRLPGYDHATEYSRLQPKRQELYRVLKPGGKLASV